MANNTPSLHDLIDITLQYGGLLNQLWNFYAVVVVAIIGWLLTIATSKEKELTFGTRFSLTIGFLIFAVINWFSLYVNYDRFDHLMKATSIVVERTYSNDEQLLNQLKYVFQPFQPWSPNSRFAIDAVVVIMIWVIGPRRAANGSSTKGNRI